MKKSLLTITFALSVFIMQAQIPQLQWVKQFENPPPVYGCYAGGTGRTIAVDAAKNVYTAGNFGDTMDFDPGPGIYNLDASISAGSSGIFISKLDSAGNFIWAKGIEGSYLTLGGWTQGNDLVLDSDGNSYILGQYYGAGGGTTIDFDPGVGTFYMTAPYGSSFILKLDPFGNFVWAKSFTGTNAFSTFAYQGIALDASGNIYSAGSFSGTIDFNPDTAATATYNLTSIGYSYNTYITKLSPSGDFLWAKLLADTLGIDANYIALDTAGNAYITGIFQETVDFDPDTAAAAVYNLPDGGAYVLKLNPSGQFVWAKGVPGAANGYAIAVDPIGNSYTTGFFAHGGDFDPGSGTYLLSGAGFINQFVLKLNPSGDFIWAKGIGGAGSHGILPFSIAIDRFSNVYTTGQFADMVDFDPDSTTYPLSAIAGKDDIFILKLDVSGNFVWAGNIAGSTLEGYCSPGGGGASYTADFGFSIAVDDDQSIYTTGQFQGAVDFDPDTVIPDTLTATSLAAGANVFVHKMSLCTSSLGTPVITQHTGSDSLYASSAATYQWYKDGVLISGANTQSYLPAETGNYSVCSTAHGEICKVCSNSFSFATGINEHSLTNAIAIYPNPNNGQFEIALQLNTQDNYTLELTNALGQVLYHEELKNYIGNYHKQLDETKYGAGIYLFRVKNSKGQGVKKVISW